MARAKEVSPRDRTVVVMMTAGEKALLQEEASEAGQSLSGYSREILLGRPLRPVVPEVNQAKWIELAATTANLNQIAYNLNRGKQEKSETIMTVITALQTQVESLRAELLGG